MQYTVQHIGEQSYKRTEKIERRECDFFSTSFEKIEQRCRDNAVCDLMSGISISKICETVVLKRRQTGRYCVSDSHYWYKSRFVTETKSKVRRSTMHSIIIHSNLLTISPFSLIAFRDTVLYFLFAGRVLDMY